MARTIQKIRIIPDLPGVRNLPDSSNEVELQAEFEQWKALHGGSFPEFLVFDQLEKRGLEYRLDFDFQAAQFGGRQELGGAIVDFILRGLIAGRVQGEFFHFRNTASRIANLLQRIKLEEAGFIVVDMLASEVEQSPSRIVDLFIQGQETSEAARISGRGA